jgi:hypothetical protein
MPGAARRGQRGIVTNAGAQFSLFVRREIVTVSRVFQPL